MSHMVLTSQLLKRSLTYHQYLQLIEELAEQGKSTGGVQNAEYLEYSKLNLHRMKRVAKTTTLLEPVRDILSKIQTDLVWLVLTEGWCGDAAQNLPIMRLIEEQCPKISLLLLLRDEHPEIMDLYLTAGSRSIPKLICFRKEQDEESKYTEVFTWGPRPAELQKMVLELKLTSGEKGIDKKARGLMVQQWYNTDKSHSLQMELQNLLSSLV